MVWQVGTAGLRRNILIQNFNHQLCLKSTTIFRIQKFCSILPCQLTQKFLSALRRRGRGKVKTKSSSITWNQLAKTTSRMVYKNNKSHHHHVLLQTGYNNNQTFSSLHQRHLALVPWFPGESRHTFPEGLNSLDHIE